MYVLTLPIGLALLLQPPSQEKPQALLALEQARLSLFSGNVHWTCTQHLRMPEREFRFVCRYAANGDRIYEERGDQDGWVRYDRQRQPSSRFPELYMVNSDGVWRRRDTSPVCRWWKTPGEPGLHDDNGAPDAEEIRDIRFIGIHPSSVWSFRLGAQCLWGTASRPQDGVAREAEGIRWHEARRGGKFEVSAQLESGEDITWIIDAERGWNAERITTTDKHGNTFETVCDLKKWGTIWFPETITYLANGQPFETFAVLEASFNQPDDALRFTGSDFGLEPGFNIEAQNFRTATAHYPLIWDGDRPVDLDAWLVAVKSGKKEYGPTLLARQRGELSPYLTQDQRKAFEQHHREMEFRAQQKKPLSVWEQYVRDFIQRYKLNEEQSQKALSILRECQQEGSRYLDRRKSEFYGLQDQFAKARRERDSEELKRLYEKLRSLREPVDAIFEQQLKPRLEGLPTRAQRKAAGQKPD